MAVVSFNKSNINPAQFTGLHQTYLVTRDGIGQLQTTIAESFDATSGDENFQFAETPSIGTDRAPFDSESVYLLAWQTPSVTATLTGLSEGVVVGSTLVEVGSDPTQIKVDWSAVDQLAISYTGAPGFPVTDNFFFL